MREKDKREVAFWIVLILAAIAIGAYAAAGCLAGDSKADAEQSSAAGVPPTKSADASDELAQQHRSHEVESVEAGKLDAEGKKIDDPEAKQRVLQKVRDYAQAKHDAATVQEEPAEEPEEVYEDYYEPVYYGYSGYSGGATATTTHDLLNGQGRAYDENGTSYTYYNHDLGWGALDIPGENFDADGVSHDGDGYIVVAADGHAKGEVIDTPYGQAKVYDSGSGYGNVDIYTNR